MCAHTHVSKCTPTRERLHVSKQDLINFGHTIGYMAALVDKIAGATKGNL